MSLMNFALSMEEIATSQSGISGNVSFGCAPAATKRDSLYGFCTFSEELTGVVILVIQGNSFSSKAIKSDELLR